MPLVNWPIAVFAIAQALAVAIAAAFAVDATAQQAKPDIGKREYDNNCAACHGASGRGDGPMRPHLKTPPPDLTVLAKSNGGVMPIARVYETIDGTRQIDAHGSTDMPVWGREFLVRSGEYRADTMFDPEALVRARILAVIDYLYRLQQK